MTETSCCLNLLHQLSRFEDQIQIYEVKTKDQVPQDPAIMMDPIPKEAHNGPHQVSLLTYKWTLSSELFFFF